MGSLEDIQNQLTTLRQKRESGDIDYLTFFRQSNELLQELINFIDSIEIPVVPQVVEVPAR